MYTIVTDAKDNTGLENTQYFNGFGNPGDPIKSAEYFINKTYHFPFRKLEMKRRQLSDGLYEPNWQDITKYVTKWGSYKISVDDQQVNRFTFSGFTFNVKNDYGEFNPEYNGSSLFYGYFTRYRTLIRLSAGYTNGSGDQFPPDPVQGIFIMDAEVDIAPSNKEVQMVCKSIISPFQETGSNQITGISTGSLTSSEIFSKIRDATDGSNNYLFRHFITSTSWSIQTTTTIVTGLNTATALDQFSTWELMNKLAEAEGYVIYPTRLGGLVFSDRLSNTDYPTFSLYGAGYYLPNIIKINSYKESTNKLYTHVRLKFSNDETESSYVEAGTSVTIDVRSNEWKYGKRTYSSGNVLLGSNALAAGVASTIVTQFSNLKNELNLDCFFFPHLDILDRVDVYYKEGSLGSDYVWDKYMWASDTTTTDSPNVLFWASETSSSVLFDAKEFKIISQETNLDNFTTKLNLREI